MNNNNLNQHPQPTDQLASDNIRTAEVDKPTAGETAEAPQWYAIRTRHDHRAARALAAECDEVFHPCQTVSVPGHKDRVRSLMPHILFVRTTRSRILELEQRGRRNPEANVTFWVYRYPADDTVRVITQRHIDLLRLLTADDPTRCEIYNRTDFRPGQRVRVIDGIYAGYEGTVQRVRRNRHVIVRIPGICLVMLPYLHPDLLTPLP